MFSEGRRKELKKEKNGTEKLWFLSGKKRRKGEVNRGRKPCTLRHEKKKKKIEKQQIMWLLQLEMRRWRWEPD